MLICSACLWVDFTNRYDIIERRKMLDNMSLFRKANMVFIKSAWFESGVLTKISYYTLRFSQMLFAAACIFFLCWNHTVHVWTVLENISVAYLIFVLFLNGPLALSGSSASDTTKLDFSLFIRGVQEHRLNGNHFVMLLLRYLHIGVECFEVGFDDFQRLLRCLCAALDDNALHPLQYNRVRISNRNREGGILAQICFHVLLRLLIVLQERTFCCFLQWVVH